MAFNTYEASNYDGKPVALYEFSYQTLVWRYTDADRDYTWNGDTWTAVAINDGGISQGQNEDLKITMPADLPVIALYRATPPAGEVGIKIRRVHAEDVDQAAAVQWVGTIADVERPDDVSAEIRGRTLSPSFARAGLRLCWEKNCPHFVYDPGCKVDKDDYATPAEITGVTGNSIDVDTFGAYTAAAFRGGFFTWDIGSGTLERRDIESASGDTLTLLGAADGLEVGMSIIMYPGCNRTIAYCDSFFSNHDNMGGIPHLANKSPFDGNPVY